MATRRVCQRALLRRMSPRLSSATSARVRMGSAVAVRLSLSPSPATTATATATATPTGWWKSASAAGVRRYSGGADNQVPNSRIWAFGEIKALVENKDPKENVVIVDVREPSELLETGKIPGAINIPITSAVQSFHISEEDFEDMYGYSRPPKDASLLFYCKAGVRARAAAGLAQHAGWTSVGEYPGSWLDWDMNKGPVEVVKQRRQGQGDQRTKS